VTTRQRRLLPSRQPGALLNSVRALLGPCCSKLKEKNRSQNAALALLLLDSLHEPWSGYPATPTQL
jgi:hypothetical protein